MLRWLRRKVVGFLLNSLELEEKPAHSGIFCEASHSLLCCPQGQNVRFVRSHSEPCHLKHPCVHSSQVLIYPTLGVGLMMAYGLGLLRFGGRCQNVSLWNGYGVNDPRQPPTLLEQLK